MQAIYSYFVITNRKSSLLLVRFQKQRHARRNSNCVSFDVQVLHEFDCISPSWLFYKERKVAKIRNRYNQVPHLTQDTTWASDKTQLNNTNKSQYLLPSVAASFF